MPQPAPSPRPSKPSTPDPQVPWPALLREARSRFGIQRFRPGQREVLEAVFTGRDALGLIPTGAGKSLTYQLPALFLPRPVLVVCPLIALMQDQQEKAGRPTSPSKKLTPHSPPPPPRPPRSTSATATRSSSTSPPSGSKIPSSSADKLRGWHLPLCRRRGALHLPMGP